MKYIILILSIVVISSCTSRENYDPLIKDMKACQELIKVKNCLDKFKRQFSLWDYTKKIFKHSYPKSEYDFLEISDALCYYHKYKEKYGDPSSYTTRRRERTRYIKDPNTHTITCVHDSTDYIDYNLKNSMKIPKVELEEIIKITNATNDLYTYLEKYLYTQCKSKVILKEEVKFPDEYLFIDEILNELMSIFNSCNTPAIDYSELINDDEKHYQVWAISKESDKHRNTDTRITVFFNDKNKRTYMRLFHSTPF